MTLSSPFALLLALTIPVVLVLWMLRPRRPRLRVPSLMFWEGRSSQQQAARPWQRIRNHRLLWLQVAAAALLALAAARPFLPSGPAGRHLVVFLDASGSMRARDVAPDRFTYAKSVVADLARGLGPDQDLTLIRLGTRPRVLVANTRSADALRTVLGAQQPGFGSANLAAATALAAGLIHGPAEWVVVSDGGVRVPPDTHLPPGTGFRFVAVGRPAGNVAVAGLAVRTSASEQTVQAAVRNLGQRPVNGQLRLLAEGRLLGVQSWRAEPGATTYLTWSHLPRGPRWYEADLGGVDPSANALPQDDRAWVGLAGSERPAVLLVTAGNSFLERLFGIYDGVRPFRAAPADWPNLAKETYSLTVLDRLWPDRSPKGSALLVGPPVGETFRPARVWLRPDQPLLAHVNWTDVHVGAARKLPLDASWETLIDSDGGPLLAVRDLGGHREAAMAFALSDSDLPLRPAFPVLMANLLDWLLPRAASAPREIAPGDSLAVAPSPLARQVWIEGANGFREDLAPPWPPRPFQPPAPGLYHLIQQTDAGRQDDPVIAAGYAPDEADLTPRRIELTATAGQPPPADRSALVVWPWLAAGILLLSLAEWWTEART